MRLIALAAMAAVTASGCAVAKPVKPAAGGQGPCPVLVRFGSYAGGIDKPAADSVAAALGADRRAGSVTVRPWGREGERDLCVMPSRPADAADLAAAAQAALPRRELRGYVDILLDGRRVFTTQTPSPA